MHSGPQKTDNSMDGAFVLIPSGAQVREDGYREAMVGAITFTDVKGERSIRFIP